jgi:spore coat protein U-like protein
MDTGRQAGRPAVTTATATVKGFAMRGMIFGAAAVLMVTMAGSVLVPAHAQLANSMPLTFGMTADQASQVLGTQLIYVRGRPGNEMYLALPNVKGSALSDRRDGLYLQFRRGKLDGWKGDWGTNRPCCN